MTDSSVAHPADRLLAAIDAKRSPVCVGIDPVFERLPKSLENQEQFPTSHITPIVNYCMGILGAIRETIPCVKYQSACFERYRPFGASALAWLVKYTHSLGFEVILDAKRGDIGS